MTSSNPGRALARAALSLALPAALALLGAGAQADNANGGISDGYRFGEQDGASLYRAVCQSCHMPAGQGAQGAGMYPALARNPRVAASRYVASNVLHGRRGMPAFKNALSDEQVAQVVNYVRTHLGNDYQDPISAADVKSLR